MECIRLRVKNVAFSYHQIKIWGKGENHRITVLQRRYENELHTQIKNTRMILIKKILKQGKYSSCVSKGTKSARTVNTWHGLIFVQAGWRGVVGYVRQPDRAKMESCRIFTKQETALCLSLQPWKENSLAQQKSLYGNDFAPSRNCWDIKRPDLSVKSPADYSP